MTAPQMITGQKAGPINKSVLLFSGGMDSICYARLLKPDILLYIPTGARYEEPESEFISQLLYYGMLPRDSELISLGGVLNLGQFERDDMIVPNRNVHLVCLASHYGDTIYLSSVQGDRSTDKDETFYALMVVLLDHTWGQQHWCDERRFKIKAPYKDITKTRLVREYLKAGGPASAFAISYSCYRGTREHCGICKPCFRKRVALENNGVVLADAYWEQDFWLQDWFKEIWPSIQKGEYRGAEDADIVEFMSRH